MADYTPWSILIDAGLIGALLAVGAALRAWIKPLQTLMIPASIIAGFLGLIFGPTGLGWLPFSEYLGTYSSVLIVLVFTCLALSSDFDFSKIKGPIANFAGYSILMYSAQVALGMLLVLVLITPLMGADPAHGLLIFAGWAGGFGTAAAIGQVFTEAGQPELQSLAFTSATIGTLVGVVGGIIQAKIGADRGYAKEFAGISSVPEEMRTGLLKHHEDRSAIGHHTFSGASIESLAFHFGLVAAIAAGAYGVTQLLGEAFPAIAFPTFSVGFLVGLVIRWVLSAIKATKYIDRTSLDSISGASTDVLIVCGIASIVPQMVTDSALELTILFVFALILCLILGIVVAPRVMEGAWFEKQIFTWGWATGAVATGIALLRIIDPKMKSDTLDDFAIAYIPVVPVEVTAVTFAPSLVLAGAAWSVVGIWGAIGVAAMIFLIIATRGRGTGSKEGDATAATSTASTQ